MLEYLSYSLPDLLMFSPRVYYRLIELYNEAVAPAQALTIGFGLAMLVVLIRGGRAVRFIAPLLGAGWLWFAYGFLWERFATINWPVSYVVPLTLLQGLMLVGSGAKANWLNLSPGRSMARAAGLFLFAAAIVFYPFIAPLLERPWAAAEIFGLMPEPTAIATLAFLAIVSGGLRWLLMIIPVLWCAISSVTLWTLGSEDYFVPFGGALFAVCIGLINSFHTAHRHHQAG